MSWELWSGMQLCTQLSRNISILFYLITNVPAMPWGKFTECLCPCSAMSNSWPPTPIFMLGKAHGWRSLVGYNPWGRKELDTTERLHFTSVSSVPCSWIEQPSLQSSPLKSRNFIPSTNFTLNRDRTRTQTQMHIFFLGQLPDWPQWPVSAWSYLVELG